MRMLRKSVSVVSVVMTSLVFNAFALPAAAQAPLITGAEKQCVLRVPYPLFDALVEPAGNVEVARIYFRAQQHPDYYWVKMEPGATGFEAIIPAPSAETEAIVYYVEAVSKGFDSGRTDEFTVRVIDDEGDCDGEVVALYTGPEPTIVVVGSTAGAAAIPPGFAGAGIAGGIAGGVAGGIPPWVWGVGAAGVIGAGILILDDGNPSSDPSSPSEP